MVYPVCIAHRTNVVPPTAIRRHTFFSNGRLFKRHDTLLTPRYRIGSEKRVGSNTFEPNTFYEKGVQRPGATQDLREG